MSLFIGNTATSVLDPLPASPDHVRLRRRRSSPPELGRPHWVDPFDAEADRYGNIPAGNMLSGVGDAGGDDGFDWSQFGTAIGLQASGRVLDWLGLDDKSNDGGLSPEQAAALQAQRDAAARSRSMMPLYIGGGILATAVIVALVVRKKK